MSLTAALGIIHRDCSCKAVKPACRPTMTRPAAPTKTAPPANVTAGAAARCSTAAPQLGRAAVGIRLSSARERNGHTHRRDPGRCDLSHLAGQRGGVGDGVAVASWPERRVRIGRWAEGRADFRVASVHCLGPVRQHRMVPVAAHVRNFAHEPVRCSLHHKSNMVGIRAVVVVVVGGGSGGRRRSLVVGGAGAGTVRCHSLTSSGRRSVGCRTIGSRRRAPRPRELLGSSHDAQRRWQLPRGRGAG